MKSDLINESEANFYTHCLIYTEGPTGRREALALFREDWESENDFINARNLASDRLASIVYGSLVNESSSINSIRLSIKPENLLLIGNVKTQSVRLAKNLSDYDDDKEIYYFWDLNAKLMEPFQGGVGVIPSETPYTIAKRTAIPCHATGIFPTIGG